MMRPRGLLGAMLVLLFGAAPAAAQADGCGLSTLAAARKAGGFAEYRIEGGEGAGTMRLTLIRTEKKNGIAMERLEMQMVSPRAGGGPVVMQMLVPAWPFETGEIGELIMQAPGQPAMLMPASMLGMMSQRGAGGLPAMSVDRSCKDVKLVGTEKMSVPGGTFDAKHYRNDREGLDLWISPAVTGWGLVKMTGQGSTMTLTALGANGKSALVGDPMEMPMGMPGRP